jgi:beta-phosphoglucomutase family hydrolase
MENAERGACDQSKKETQFEAFYLDDRSSMTAPLGLSPHITACLFDLDGVITATATVHARAWKQVFDEFHIPYDEVADYDAYVDGKPRVDGVRSVLEARHTEATGDLVEKIAARKDDLFLQLIHEHGVETYPGSLRYLQAVRQDGKQTAVVSSSKNTTEVLHAAGLRDLFDAQVDGNVAEREQLRGKPQPDTYWRAAELLHTAPDDAAVYEDALAGVEAGRAGGFGMVIGVDRAGQAEALKAHGADVVVRDLADLLDGNA